MRTHFQRARMTLLTKDIGTRDGTVDYQGRQHDIDFVLKPYYGSANLSFADAQKTLVVRYRRTLLYTERERVTTTGLDALGVRRAQAGFPIITSADPQIPIASPAFNHLSLDLEGLVLNADGRRVFSG